MGFEQRIPLNFVSQAIGLRVLKLGSMEPEKLLEAAAPFISHENENSCAGFPKASCRLARSSIIFT
jgi:hypothetical protein